MILMVKTKSQLMPARVDEIFPCSPLHDHQGASQAVREAHEQVDLVNFFDFFMWGSPFVMSTADKTCQVIMDFQPGRLWLLPRLWRWAKSRACPRWQLLLNCCFGHKGSSLLLCPDVSAALANHCSSCKKQRGPGGPSAQLWWPSGWEPKSDELRNMTLDEISQQSGHGLSVEIVALRDIKPGQEVRMGCGEGWESARGRHTTGAGSLQQCQALSCL